MTMSHKEPTALVIENHDEAISRAENSLSGDVSNSLRHVVAALKSQGEMLTALYDDRFGVRRTPSGDSIRLEFLGVKLRGAGAGIVIVAIVGIAFAVLKWGNHS